MRNPVSLLALRAAESTLGGRLAALAAQRVPALIPLRRVALTDGAIAVLHPRPEYPDHVVIAPRAYVRDLHALVEDRRRDALVATLDLARRLDAARPPGGRMFTISNGSRLHVKHVHGHLVRDEDAFWIARDQRIEIGAPPARDPDAILEAIGAALARIGGRDVRGSLLLQDLHADHLRVAITIAPPGDAG